jgi:hypothetical protein
MCAGSDVSLVIVLDGLSKKYLVKEPTPQAGYVSRSKFIYVRQFRSLTASSNAFHVFWAEQLRVSTLMRSENHNDQARSDWHS